MTKPFLLLCSSRSPESLGLSQTADDYRLLITSSIEQAIQCLRKEVIAVFVMDRALDPQLQFLQSSLDIPASVVRLVITDHVDFDFFQTSINRARIFRLVLKSEFGEKFRRAIDDALKEYQQDLRRVELVRKSSRQNRELEELTLSLESRVEERTKSILTAKEQEEEKLHRIRRLVRFIKDLTVTASVEDLLVLVRNDLRPFHQVVAPALMFPMSTDELALVFLSKSQVVLRSVPMKMEVAEDYLLNLLANQMARPIAKVLKIELELKPRSAFLFVEHTATFKESKQLESHLNELRRPLEMTLERLLLEFENNFYSFRWEKTFDNLNEPISIIDREMQVLRSNQKFSDRHRKGACHALFAGYEKICEGCPVGEVIRSGRAQTGNIHVRGRLYQVQSFPIRLTVDGSITNVINLYEDITTQKELQRKVLQSEKMSAIGLLAGNIAHELNNPLTGLRSLAQVLLSQVKDGSTTAADLKEIEKAAARSQAIIKNLLEFTNPTSQAMQVTTLDDVVEKTLPFLKSMMRNHRMSLDLQTRHAEIRVEPNLLQQVVFNLINNACQSMGKGGTLSLRSQVVGKQVQLQVQDTGVGIPEEHRDRVFEPFFTTKSEGHGTGLGLSLSREIIEKFHGRIFFTSEKDVGTTFTIELPMEVS